MNNPNRPPSRTLVSSMLPHKTERELILELAHAHDTSRESQERHNSMMLETMRRHGAGLEQVKNIVADLSGHVAELTGHIARADSTATHASEQDITAAAELAKERAAREAMALELAALKENDAKQNAELAKQTEMITAVKNAVVGTVNNPKVRFVGKMLWIAALGYAAAKGLKVLP